MQNSSLIGLVIGLPVLGFLVQALFGGMLVRNMGPEAGKRACGFLAVLPIALAFGIGLMLTLQLSNQAPSDRSQIVTLFHWIQTQPFSLPFELRIDPLSMTMVLIITGIGSLIHLYATGYMAEEREYSRFFTYLNLFIAFMLVLVLGNNLGLLFIGWEGVGLCSYLLIGFWYKDLANSRAANKAFIVNRIGDWGLSLGLFLIVAMIAGNTDRIGDVGGRYLSYDVIFKPEVLSIFSAHPGLTTAAALLLFVGAMGKSAQFPLYIWLPDAMAGPTPVSALIHAATMVTSGVVLLNRMHALFELSPIASTVVAVVGAFTALFAAFVAFGQTDIKKVLAYSTVSQLGFMFVACGVGSYWVGMFHVTTHAFFKALLFLGSGAVIHAMSHDQDMRHYGRLYKYIKITGVTMLIGWLAIAGVPPLAGFWSKEAILGGAMGNKLAVINGVNVGQYCGWVLLFVAFLTAAYMTRMTLLTFFGPKEQWRDLHPGHHDEEEHAHAEHHAYVGHDHADDHGFFYSDAEMEAMPHEHEHHHELDAHHEPHEVPPSMWVPLAILAVLSVAGGYLMANHEAFMHWLYPSGLSFLNEEVVSGEPTGQLAQSIPVVGNLLGALGISAGLLGIFYGWVIYRKGLPENEGFDLNKWSPFRLSAGRQFGYDDAMVQAGVEGGGVLANFCYRILDVKGVDGIVNGAATVVGGVGTLVRKAQTGFVRTYAAFMLMGAVGVIAYLVYAISGGVR